MLHLRVIVPPETSEAVVDLLAANPGVTHLIVLPAAARQPPGDVVLCDVVREAGSPVLAALRELGVEKTGSIAIDSVDVSLSEAAERAADAVPGLAADAVVWDEIEQKTGEETELSATYLIFLSVATIIAGIGVLLDSPILIVGAMVVGPEFGPLAALCVGIVQRRWHTVLRSTLALAIGFPVAMAATVATTVLLSAGGLISKDMLLGDRPLTSFIWQPDALSWIVGFLAGVAGMLSLTSAKSGALVGVLISVTTVPAAANVAVALAFGVPDEAIGSAVQFFVNVAAIIAAGILTLVAQRLWWRYRAAGTAATP